MSHDEILHKFLRHHRCAYQGDVVLWGGVVGTFASVGMFGIATLWWALFLVLTVSALGFKLYSFRAREHYLDMYIQSSYVGSDQGLAGGLYITDTPLAPGGSLSVSTFDVELEIDEYVILAGRTHEVRYSHFVDTYGIPSICYEIYSRTQSPYESSLSTKTYSLIKGGTCLQDSLRDLYEREAFEGSLELTLGFFNQIYSPYVYFLTDDPLYGVDMSTSSVFTPWTQFKTTGFRFIQADRLFGYPQDLPPL